MREFGFNLLLTLILGHLFNQIILGRRFRKSNWSNSGEINGLCGTNKSPRPSRSSNPTPEQQSPASSACTLDEHLSSTPSLCSLTSIYINKVNSSFASL